MRVKNYRVVPLGQSVHFTVEVEHDYAAQQFDAVYAAETGVITPQTIMQLTALFEAEHVSRIAKTLGLAEVAVSQAFDTFHCRSPPSQR